LGGVNAGAWHGKAQRQAHRVRARVLASGCRCPAQDARLLGLAPEGRPVVRLQFRQLRVFGLDFVAHLRHCCLQLALLGLQQRLVLAQRRVRLRATGEGGAESRPQSTGKQACAWLSQCGVSRGRGVAAALVPRGRAHSTHSGRVRQHRFGLLTRLALVRKLLRRHGRSRA
jgi:hypothetical protein